jgi:hypothetical protein
LDTSYRRRKRPDRILVLERGERTTRRIFGALDLAPTRGAALAGNRRYGNCAKPPNISAGVWMQKVAAMFHRHCRGPTPRNRQADMHNASLFEISPPNIAGLRL